MRILHVVDSISRAGGGPSRSCQGLVAGLNSCGIDAWLMTLQSGEQPWISGVDKFINGGDVGAALAKVDPVIVHLHGVWSLGLHKMAGSCRKAGVPYVIAPRGMLEPWSLRTKWLKKRIARFLYQDGDLKYAAALHATAESEAEQFRALGFTNPVIISPNGVNVPVVLPPCASNLSNSSNPSNVDKKRRALFVSRMHPKKGVLELVDAWAKVRPADWCCELVYTVGSDEERAYEKKVKDRILALGMSYTDGVNSTVHLHPPSSVDGVAAKEDSPSPKSPDFIFTGKLDDDRKWEAYRRADLFVLPTYSENFGIVVAEALYAGVPVITTKGTPWQDLVDHKCGWWIDLPPTDSLVVALREAIQLFNLQPSTFNLLGQRGQALVQDKYTWAAVCKPMVDGYNSILSNAD